MASLRKTFILVKIPGEEVHPRLSPISRPLCPHWELRAVGILWRRSPPTSSSAQTSTTTGSWKRWRKSFWATLIWINEQLVIWLSNTCAVSSAQWGSVGISTQVWVLMQGGWSLIYWEFMWCYLSLVGRGSLNLLSPLGQYWKKPRLGL